MSAAPELKCFSVLLAWNEDDHEAGTYAWSGLAADEDSAVQLARETAARDSDSYAMKCENCGCTDQDGSEICPDCGAEGSYVEPDDLMDNAPSDIVLDSMEGVNMWAAPEGLAMLREIMSLPGAAVDIERAGLGDKFRATIARLEGRDNG